MGNLFIRLARQASVFLAALAFLTVSTATLAHGHPDTKSIDESHCALCMAVHSTSHVVAASVVTLSFAAIQTAFLVPSDSLVFSFAQSLPIQDRAPPQL